MQKEQIQQEIKAANCTEYELIGIMEDTIMKVMSTLESKYQWYVQPSVLRLQQLSDNRNANQGIRHYVEFSPAEVWADMFNMDGFADDGKLIRLPELAPDAGHKVDLRTPEKPKKQKKPKPPTASEIDQKNEANPGYYERSPTRRPGQDTPRRETLRLTTLERAVGDRQIQGRDPARHGQVSSRSTEANPLVSPLPPRRPQRSRSRSAGRRRAAGTAPEDVDPELAAQLDDEL